MAYTFQEVTVLVVEDNQPMMEIVRSLLITFGVGDVICAKNGEEGFELYKERKPDLVIADWMMKPMNGIDLTQKIRTSSDTPNPFCPIILMTGFSEKSRVLEARDAGVTEFLVKPFHVKDLYKRLAQIIERPRQFVDSQHFFGPDRRRKTDANYEGPMRREGDDPATAPAQLQEGTQAAGANVESDLEKRKAHETLKKIRTETGKEKGDKFG